MLPSSTNSGIILRLLDGRSEQRELRLEAGSRRPPFAVGSRGAWRIDGGQVATSHVMLAYNGDTLYVCVMPGEKALLDGTPLDGRWIEVSPPSELRFGTARLSIGRRAGPEEATQLPPPRYSHDHDHDKATRIADVRVASPGRAAWTPREEEATTFDSERLRAALARSTQDEEVTCIAEVDVPQAARRPSVVPPVGAKHEPRVGRPPSVSAGARPPPLPLPAVLPFLPASARTLAAPELGWEKSAELPRADARSSMPPTIPSEGLMHAPLHSDGSFAAPFKVAVWRPSSPTRAIPVGHDASCQRAGDSLDGFERAALAATGETSSSKGSQEVDSAAPVAPNTRLGEMVKAWKATSLPKRAIVLLMVPTLFAALFTISPARAPEEPPASATAVVSVTTTATALPVAAAAPAATTHTGDAGAAPAPADRPRPAAAGLHETRTAERRALDTAASGNDTSATEQYEALAAANPDNVAFREAARILRERAAATRRDRESSVHGNL